MSKITPEMAEEMKRRVIANGGSVGEPTVTKNENNANNTRMGSPIAQHDTASALVESSQGEVPRVGSSKPSHIVEITISRLKLLDRDNKWACVKALVDGLVAAGLIPGDKESEIDLIVRQEKVATRKEIKTVIEISNTVPELDTVLHP